MANLKRAAGSRRRAGWRSSCWAWASNATTLYRLHPDEYLFFNPLVGGLAGASRRYDTDYWVNIMPEAIGDLEHSLDRTEGSSDKTAPRHHYLVAVCGEHLPFEKEADARLAWTRDFRHAEFFIAPTNNNCDPPSTEKSSPMSSGLAS